MNDITTTTLIAVLTSDIVSSRSMPNKSRWLRKLQEIIERKSGLSKPPRWGVFRGDGFQVELADPTEAVRIALLIRAGLKAMPDFAQLKLDARIAIGIGEKGYVGKTINEADGEAFQNSGLLLDKMKQKARRMEIKSPWPDLDAALNVSLVLGSKLVDGWTQAEAEVVWLRLSEGKTQEQMAKKLKISQPAVHKRYANSHLQELMELIAYFESTVAGRLKNRTS